MHRTRRSPSLWVSILLLALMLITSQHVVSHHVQGDESHAGKAIYLEKCASCHGDDGQGSAAHYDKPLVGERSVDALARLISRTMPEDDPGTCVGDEARQVADYIQHEFYSPAARIRQGLSAAPRIELTRLTVPQYRNAITDLVGQFTPPPPTAGSLDERGFRAEYFQSKGMSKADKLQQARVDVRIAFDFGADSPAADITADQFAIVWEGALVARETGYYEFRVRTPNGARLYLNDDPLEKRGKLRDDSGAAGQAALIDAWVSSGEMQEATARLFLLGGRNYPIRVEFFKYQEKTASIELAWKPPRGVWTILDSQHIVTFAAPRSFVVETPFPADDRSLGYERGRSVSSEWHVAVSQGAVATASEIINRLPYLLLVANDAADRPQKIEQFILDFAEVAYRRPLVAEEKETLRSLCADDPDRSDAGLRRALLVVLQSPYFLYTDLAAPAETSVSYAIASRLAWTLWDSLPDAALREAARNGRLSSAEGIREQAKIMLADPRARTKVRGFFRHWLELEERDLAKDQQIFPDFDEAVIADLRLSLEKFVEDVVWSEQSDYRQLLQADYLVLNDRLRKLYAPLDESAATLTEPESTNADDPFQLVAFSPERRAGVLTHPYLLSAFAYHNNTSPIHRGVFLTRNIVGRSLKSPPIAVAFKNDEFPPDLTMREKVTQLTRDSACMACHSAINPLGFALENYDAVGRWRTEDNAKPVDTKSEYLTDEGEKLEVKNARDIANFAVSSESAHRAFVIQMFHHLVKQPPAAYGSDIPESLRLEFERDNFNIQHLIVRIATLAALQHEVTTSEVKP